MYLCLFIYIYRYRYRSRYGYIFIFIFKCIFIYVYIYILRYRDISIDIDVDIDIDIYIYRSRSGYIYIYTLLYTYIYIYIERYIYIYCYCVFVCVCALRRVTVHHYTPTNRPLHTDGRPCREHSIEEVGSIGLLYFKRDHDALEIAYKWVFSWEIMVINGENAMPRLIGCIYVSPSVYENTMGMLF